MRRKVFAITAILAASLQMTAGAYIDLGNGSVKLEAGDSYGSVAAAFGINYYNLGYFNGVDPDSVTVYPGDIIRIGTASADSFYNGTNNDSLGYYEPVYTVDKYGYTINTNWLSSPYYGCEAYNEYSIEYSYEANGAFYSGYSTLAANGTMVDYGVATLRE